MLNSAAPVEERVGSCALWSRRCSILPRLVHTRKVIMIFFGELVKKMALVTGQNMKVIAAVVVGTLVVTLFLGPEHFNGIDDDEPFVMIPLNRLYFVMTTLSTVGYGDISPKSPIAKLISILIMTSMLSLAAF